MKSKRAREAATEAVEDVLPLNDAPTEDKKKRKRSADESGEQGKLKKAKKDKKDKTDKKKSKKGAFEETRREKKDKRKNLQDLPEEDADEEEVENQGDAAAPAAADASKSKKEKSASKSSKSSKSAGTDVANEEKTTVEKAVSAQDGTEESTKKKKKEKKAKKDKDEKSTTTNEETTLADDPATETGKPSRHIVFVGNLPFSATAASIKAHFATLNPISVRCLKNKDDANPCRGIAFVEFANVWSMRTCLDKFHHTIFEDGVSAGRKINVELTAGGGGSTKFRKDKIREKNVKLDENRAKRIDKEKTAKQQGGGEKKGRQGKEAGVEVGVHPSRLARNPGLSGR
ncbi:hypothetical protein E4U52_003555 [Claviceps spartinae]|nr:hypothetical protein E4U52_003555 [Claviceps spartinae]KAG6101426.1 hypothetical protein E4U30_002099 [Claviceps sp. LM220 group G6]KAG6106978.1 hypothetical protein E4U31_000401 [Claviceps sp. LM219 group G6]